MVIVGDVPGLIRRCRSLANLSQREFASMAGVSPGALARIETGDLVPSLRLLVSLIDVAGCRLVLLDRDGREVQPEDLELRDRAGRRFPSHLDLRPVGPEGQGWWGERTVSPWIRLPPEYTFTRNPRG
jgi:transcriptional regulator with XRE-family HTH domain